MLQKKHGSGIYKITLFNAQGKVISNPIRIEIEDEMKKKNVIKGKTLEEIKPHTLYMGCTFYVEKINKAMVYNTEFDNCSFRGEVSLSLRDAKLDEIPSWVWDISGLTELDVSKNHLEKISPKRVMGSLKKLDVRSCGLKSLKKFHEHFPCLEWVNVSNNFWEKTKTSLMYGDLTTRQTFADEFDSPDISDILKIKTLKILRANNLVSLRKVSSEILELKQLGIIDFSRCSIEEFPDVSSLTNLRILDLKHNKIKTFPLVENHSIEQIFLDYNPLAKIPEDINIPNARRVDLCDTNIKRIPDKLFTMPRLSYIYNDIRDSDMSDAHLEWAGLNAKKTEVEKVSNLFE